MVKEVGKCTEFIQQAAWKNTPENEKWIIRNNCEREIK